jgi:hypothetical protein
VATLKSMISFLVSLLPAIRVTRSQLFRSLSILVLTSALSGVLLAQTDPNATDPGAANANGNGGGRGRRNQNGGGNGGGRGNFDPAQMQQQMLAALRDQFGVTDDSEWKIISDKITAVSDLRRSVGGGGGGFGGLRGGGGGNRGGRGGAVANPEQDALRQAITDKLPDAEIKSRLARLREVRKANEEKLTKAQEDLRGVLSVRQEAVAVMAGLLP